MRIVARARNLDSMTNLTYTSQVVVALGETIFVNEANAEHLHRRLLPFFGLIFAKFHLADRFPGHRADISL